MKCAHCGSDLIDGARFCDACGALVVENSPTVSPSEPSEPIPPPSPIYEPQSEAQPYPPPPQPVVNFDVISPPGSYASNTGSSNIGLISLILGIAGLVFSCLGCGGLFSIAGAITGFMSLKTSSKSQGIIGLILSALGLIATLIFVCLFLFAIFSSTMSGTNTHP